MFQNATWHVKSLLNGLSFEFVVPLLQTAGNYSKHSQALYTKLLIHFVFIIVHNGTLPESSKIEEWLRESCQSHMVNHCVAATACSWKFCKNLEKHLLAVKQSGYISVYAIWPQPCLKKKWGENTKIYIATLWGGGTVGNFTPFQI